MFERLDSCPSCGHQNFTNQLVIKDHSISGESFVISKCQQCKLLFTNPRPDLENIYKYYESADYISHSNASNTLISHLYKFIRSYTLKQKEKLIRTYNNGVGSLLDYGCGTAHFLQHANTKGWNVTGIEPSATARANVHPDIQSKVTSTFSSTPETYDVITAWHVIEHVHHLNETIEQLRSRLSNKGHLLIAVPNVESYDSKYYKDKWAALDVPRHLYHFSPESFKKLISGNKLRIIVQLPMKFDSYYVSLLSEKYLNNKFPYFKAFQSGLASNRQAKKDGNYSSLIYVLQK